MGGSGTSSKRKSSKRKRDKKKKSRRKELKRRQHKYDSVSSFSDDESDRERRRKNRNRKPRHDSPLSSSPVDHSSSSHSDSLSKHDRRGKYSKSRRSRVSSKGTKKKDRKRFATTSSDTDAGNARKRKRVGRDDKPKKRPSKKRSRKHLTSSSSSDSESSDGEREMPTVMELDMVRDQNVGVNDDDDVVITHVDNPRRLKSVIAVVNQINQSRDEEENDRWEMDPHKEVIVYDREDYPSPKSVDSYEGGSKMEPDGNSPGASSKPVCIENVAGEEAVEPGTRDLKSDVENKGVLIAGSGGDNLESILRQKALENLRKFRGKLQVGPKINVIDGVQNRTTEQDRSIAQKVDRSEPTLQRNVSQLSEVKNIVESGEGLVGCSNEDQGPSSGPVLANHDVRDDSSQAPANTSGGAVTGDNSVVKLQNEDTDSSQFEQRTMSVMRGGEMVQVNYKVYIPKKTPALARRQLRR